MLTSPGSACYAGLEADEELKLGNALRFFGDGWQVSKRLGDKRYWRIPVMDGEFALRARRPASSKTAVGGGNIIVTGASAETTLAATERAVEAIAAVPDVIVPFPGASRGLVPGRLNIKA